MTKTKFRNNNQANFLKKNILNLTNFNKTLFILAIVLGVFYIAGANDLTIKGFALNDLKKQYGKIADENKKLELSAMALSSYSVVSQKIDNLKMVAVGEIDYINGGSEMVAVK